jgi:polysaccharide biosynthesis PFTS motif protein
MNKFNKKKFILFKFTKKYKKKSPFFVYKIKSDLIKTMVGNNYLTKKKLPKKILSQILYKDLINEDFNQKIFECLLFKKKLSHPLPYEWCKVISNKIEVNFKLCKIFFYIYIIKLVLKKFILNFFLLCRFKSKIHEKDINMFFDLSDAMDYHLYSKKNNFFNKFSNIIKNNLIIHDNNNLNCYNDKINYRIISSKNFHFINNNIFIKLKLFIILNFKFIISIFFLLIGKIERSLLLDDFIKVIFINHNKYNKINFFFNNSTLVHRPLWTYTKYCQNISSYLYYYSSNVLALLITNKEKKIHSKEYHHFYKLLTWNKYLVASIEQKKLLKKYLDKSDYDLREIGVVPFEGKKFNFIKKKNLKYVSLFEVTPFKLRRIAFHENPFWYYNYQNTKIFYDKIIKYFQKREEWIILVKRKRLGDEKININLNYPNVKLIDPRVSAIEIINKSNLVISMPYTTPSFFARDEKIPSFFFDPTNRLQKKHINNQNIPLISSHSEIHKFLLKKKLIKSNNL